jgi:hypothetical protein
MKVLIEKREGNPALVKIYADWEVVESIEVINEWIKNLQLAKAWLNRRLPSK